MPVNPQAISKRGFQGYALETGGQGVAVLTPTLYAPGKVEIKRMKGREYIQDDRNTVDADNDVIDLIRHGEWSKKGLWYNDTDPYFLLSSLGAPTTTQPDVPGAPTAYKHVFPLDDSPSTLTIMRSYHQTTYYLPMAHVEKWTLKYSVEKSLEFDPAGKSIFPVKYTGAPLTPAYSTLKPIAGWAPVLSFGGVATTDVSEFELDFERKCQLWYPGGNSQDASRVDYGERKVKVKFTARFDTSAWMDAFDAGTDQALTLVWTGPLIGGTTAQTLSISIPVVGYDTMDIDDSKDSVLVKVNGTARSTNAGNDKLSIFVINTVTAYVS